MVQAPTLRLLKGSVEWGRGGRATC